MIKTHQKQCQTLLPGIQPATAGTQLVEKCSTKRILCLTCVSSNWLAQCGDHFEVHIYIFWGAATPTKY